MSHATAPGKIILFGEHAVVYGQPALAAPVTQVMARVNVRAAARPGCRIRSPEVGLDANLKTLPPDHPLAFAIHRTLAALAQPTVDGLEIEIRSDIPVASGLGSGAAVTVALVRALANWFGRPLEDATVNALAYETEKIHHGTPSGIDNTVVTYAQPVFFQRPAEAPPRIERLRVAAPFTLAIGDTGIPAPTHEAVADVRRLWRAAPRAYESIFAAIGSIVRAARQAIESGHPQRLGPLMNENHALLKKITVSSPELDRLVDAACQAGAWGAKLSGGGRGGNMIALCPPGKASQIQQALQNAGARRVFLTDVS